MAAHRPRRGHVWRSIWRFCLGGDAIRQTVLIIAGLHALSTLMMTGIIWFIQICHYPLFGLVGKSQKRAYVYRNRILTTYVVSPIMVVEIITAWILVFLPYIHVTLAIRIAGVVIVTLVWCSTLFLQLPTHLRLQHDWTPGTFRHLLHTNWIRTVGWTLRALIAIDIIRQLGVY